MFALSDKLKIALVVVLLIIVSVIMYAVNKNAKGVNCNQSTACPGWENSNATSAVKTCNLRTGQWAPGNACGCDIKCPATAPFPDCTNKTCKTSRPDPHPPAGKCSYELKQTEWVGGSVLPSRAAGVVTNRQGVEILPSAITDGDGAAVGGINVSQGDPQYLQFALGAGANLTNYPGQFCYEGSPYCWPGNKQAPYVLVGEGECPAKVATTADQGEALKFSPSGDAGLQPVCYNPDQGLLGYEIAPGSCATGYTYIDASL